MQTGKIKEKQRDIERIKSIKDVAERGLSFIKETAKTIPKDSDLWTFVFRDHYESLRGFIEAYLLFEGISADNHQCKNVYLCFNHDRLGVQWEFLEHIRLQRNAINYRGKLLTYNDWKAVEHNFELHINILRNELNTLLHQNI